MKLAELWRNGLLVCRNAACGLRRSSLGWVVLSLSGSFPEWAPSPLPLPFPINRLFRFGPDVSLEDVREAVDMLGPDGRVRGVVLRLDTMAVGLATAHALRESVQALRGQGKQVVAWLPSASLPAYYVASACDEVIVPCSGRLSALGLRAEVTFVKDLLALVGVTADLEAIAEYKVTPDIFRRTEMTGPHREMLDAILDSVYDRFVTGVAEGRRLEPAHVREVVDRGPLTPAEATEAGLVDAVLYEDELAAHLPDGVRLATFDQASRWLRRRPRWSSRRSIGIISLEGTLVSGRSRRLPTPVPVPLVEAQAGAETVIQSLRRAEGDGRIEAVILHIETPGGSALASDLIAREVRRLREHKPVIALMGEQATSGGYYVAAQANHIVARPTTLTGSIGIWGGKWVLSELYRRLGVTRVPLQRGAMAGLYSELVPFSDVERAWLRRDLGEAYQRFKDVVAEGRHMSVERVEEVARGRVWTGAQALEAGLVDELGGYPAALAQAKTLAGLDPKRDVSVVHVNAGRHELLPPPFPTTESSWSAALRETLQALAGEQVWALSPWTVRLC